MNNFKIKSLFFLMIITLLVSSCNNYYIQIFSTKSLNLIEKPEGWIFENDSIKVSYNFNARGGILSFKIFNKLNKPIYLDWKNSSFIYKGEKYNYWIEETNTVGTTTQSGVIGRNVLNKYDRNIYSTSIGFLNQKSVKAERITFIPPQSGISSNISYYQFRLTDSNIHFKVDPYVANRITVPDLTRKNKNLIGYEYNYNEENTIISFRNYLAISFSENSNQFRFIDNKFYVNSLKEIDVRSLDNLSKKNGTKFYIDNILEWESAHNRDKKKK